MRSNVSGKLGLVGRLLGEENRVDELDSSTGLNAIAAANALECSSIVEPELRKQFLLPLGNLLAADNMDLQDKLVVEACAAGIVDGVVGRVKPLGSLSGTVEYVRNA